MSRLRSSFVLVGAYILFVALGSFFALTRYEALAPGAPSDLAYYAVFAAHGYEKTPAIAIYPGGTSLLLSGPDGKADPHQAIHFEPFKYLTPLPYLLTHSLAGVFVWYVAIFFVPLLYGGWLIRRSKDHVNLIAVALISYALFPGAFLLASHDLRPFTILFPFLLCFYLAIALQRPSKEMLFFLVLTLLAREEGIIFAGIGILYLLLREWKEGKYRYTPGLISVALGGLIVNALYQAWIWHAYTLRSFSILTSHIHLLMLGGLLLMGAALILFLMRKHPLLVRGYTFLKTYGWMVLVPVCVAGLIVLSALSGMIVLSGDPSVLMGSRQSMLAWILILFGIFMYVPFLKSERKIVWGLGVSCLVFVLVQMLLPGSTWSAYRDLSTQSSKTSFVFAMRSEVPMGAPILLDEETLPAFADYGDVAVLSTRTTPPSADPAQFYPQSREGLITFLQTAGYVMVRQDHAVIAETLIHDAGRSIVLTADNGVYRFYMLGS